MTAVFVEVIRTLQILKIKFYTISIMPDYKSIKFF